MADEQNFMHANSSLSSLDYTIGVAILQPKAPPKRPPCVKGGFPVGKGYASIVDDEKTAFEQRNKHRQNGHKKSRYLHCSCFCRYGRVAVIYEEILISMWDESIIQLDKLEFVENEDWL